VAPVLPALALPEPGRLIDIGSGNGSPGLVFALLRADLEVTLLEPRARRWAFLREAARAAGAARVSVLRQRHDAYAGPPARTLTLRALALPLGELTSLVEAGGRLLWFGACLEASGPFELAGAGERLPEGVQVFRRLG
jgi:16S rRNA (guanine527-N7)-methyltransferase